jgi:hypothetical protein
MEKPPDSSFCLSAARTWSKYTRLDWSGDGVSGQATAIAAPPKNKKKKRDGVVLWL